MNEVRLPPSAYQTIVTHALSQEREEIIGLLCGEVCSLYIQIYTAIPFRRITHLKDRVEVADEDMILGSQKADELGKRLGQNLCVLGWYHSHPHITVHPSDQDIRTQALYEKLNGNFFGLIVSVFDNNDANKQQTISMACFRSNKEPVKLIIEPTSTITRVDDYYTACMETWRSIPRVLLDEMSNESDDCARFTKMLQFRETIIFPMTTTCESLDKHGVLSFNISHS
ncbi:lys 63 specific deubiquitinase BRCC36 [Echinococcus multilocularis]|uniref:Lys 63 specific deubiquitinase BRCC36 n=1 Tax=Echinococcus multilocularis TaxID=6211 RepID=A0A068YAU8_ECHMU|nr:lys 63 specific deubiquitinase BRCC36 [Echinococcus multilocularis]